MLAASLAGGAATPAALAQGSKAKEHYEEGTKYYNLGEFARAIDSYKKAYEAKPDPVFLYNIAQSYRLAGDARQALFFYRSYLRNRPDAQNRAEVEGRIAEMEEAARRPAIAAPPAVPAPAPVAALPTPPPAPPPAPPITRSAVAAAIPETSAGETGAAATLADRAPAGDARPVYKEWWFWGGVGAVVVGAIVIGVVASSGGGGGGAPSTHFPTEPF